MQGAEEGGMTRKKQILLCCGNQFRAEELRIILETRLSVKVTIAYGDEIEKSLSIPFRCAIFTHNDKWNIDLCREKEIPTLEIGKPPSYADRVVSGGSMMEVLEAVRLMCVKKRGPKVAPRYCDHCGKKINRFTSHKCQDAISEAA